jgi:hypothetical protein
MRICISFLLMCALTAVRGEDTASKAAVAVELIPLDKASEQFAFARVPKPSKSDAANAARITIVSGRLDDNSGRPACLNDGELPVDQDQPGRNVFFRAGSRGGRLQFQWPEPVAITQINTYSWHSDVRAPQVYKVYGDRGEKGIDAPRRTSEDPLDHGWQLLASVDTRVQDAEPGGQCGVSISAPDGLGKHGRLLFDVARTDDQSPFGLTFFSEIDIHDGSEHPPASPEQKIVEEVPIGDRYTLVFDTTETPELKPWVDSNLKPICVEWYPKIIEMLPSEGFEPAKRVTIQFDGDMDGVAYAQGAVIHCGRRWFENNLDGEAAGAVVHELVHVVQRYGRSRGGRNNPGWLVEGIADYVRWFVYEPKVLRAPPNPETAKYTDSYHTTASFLDYLVKAGHTDVVKALNTSMREGNYSPAVWERAAGGTVDDLWAQYMQSLTK